MRYSFKYARDNNNNNNNNNDDDNFTRRRSRGNLQRIESRGKKGRKRSAWPRVNSKDRGIFWARATGSLHCLKFQVVRVPVGQEVGPRANMTRVRIPWRNWCMKRGGQGRKEGRKVGAECRIISGLHMRFVFQSIMFGAARTKGVPDPKRDAREKEKEEGRDLSEIVISCYYRTRQISRRNTRGPLPIKLSSSLRHGKPSFFPSPLQRNELKGSKGSRDQFARLSYVPIDAKYPTATSSIAVQYFLSNFLFSLFSPKGKKKKKTALARHVWKYRSIGKYIGGYWGLWAVGLNEGDKGGTVTRQHDYRTRSSPTTRCSATPTLRGLEWHRVIATPQPTIRSRRSSRNCYKSSALLVNIDPPRE